jgi:hypothetical protein
MKDFYFITLFFICVYMSVGALVVSALYYDTKHEPVNTAFMITFCIWPLVLMYILLLKLFIQIKTLLS